MSSRAIRPEPQGERRLFAAALSLIVLLVLSILVFGCSPKVVEHIVHQRDTTYVEKVQIDSVFRRDSVLIREKGDTIYIYKEKVLEKYKFVRDTIVRVKVDSVAVETIKEVEVEKPLSPWKRLEIGAFWWLLGAVVLLLLWTFRKTIFKI